MRRRKFGEENEISFEEPCFDMNDKNYIKRVDVDAEMYTVKRLRASIARSSEVKEALVKPEPKKPRQLTIYSRGKSTKLNKRLGPSSGQNSLQHQQQ